MLLFKFSHTWGHNPMLFFAFLSMNIQNAVAQNSTRFANSTFSVRSDSTTSRLMFLGSPPLTTLYWTDEPPSISSYCSSSLSADFVSWSSASADGIPTPLVLTFKGTTTTTTRLPWYIDSDHISKPCCDKCSMDVPKIDIIYFPTSALPPGTTSIVSDGFTFHSPSVYAVYHNVGAYDRCGHRTGPDGSMATVLATTIGYAPGVLLSLLLDTDDNWALTLPFETDAPIPTTCRTTGWVGHTTTINGSFYHAPYCWPAVMVPDDFHSIDPAFESCNLFAYSYDPPIALTEGDILSTPTPVPGPIPNPPLPPKTTGMALPTARPLDPPKGSEGGTATPTSVPIPVGQSDGQAGGNGSTGADQGGDNFGPGLQDPPGNGAYAPLPDNSPQNPGRSDGGASDDSSDPDGNPAENLGRPSQDIPDIPASTGRNGVPHFTSPPTLVEGLSTFAIGDKTFTVAVNGVDRTMVEVDGRTVTADAPAVTINGDVLSLNGDGQLIVGSKTIIIDDFQTSTVIDADRPTKSSRTGEYIDIISSNGVVRLHGSMKIWQRVSLCIAVMACGFC